MKTLTLVIPVYNEGKRIEKILSQLKKGFNFRGITLTEITFADDGSRDDTLTVIKNYIPVLEKNLNIKIRILTYENNKGRGYAVRTAALSTRTDYVLYTDADFSIPLFNLKKFAPYLKKGYDLLFGSKKKPGAKEIVKRKMTRRIVGYSHSFIASMILGVFAWDFQGGFKLFSRRFIDECFHEMKIDRWGFDMEVIFLAKKKGYKTVELPVTWGHVENGSKVKLLRDIVRALREMSLIRYYWIKGNYIKIQTTQFVFSKLKLRGVKH